ncbi:MAG: hypothetical protein ACFFD2_29820 [Promethearchaeota archaeon]
MVLRQNLDKEKRLDFVLKSKSHVYYVSIVYAEIINLLKTKYDLEKIQYLIRKIGNKVGSFAVKYWKPKKVKSIPQLIQEYHKMAVFAKLKFKSKDKKNFIVENKNCPICEKGYMEKDIKLCDAYAASIETIVNFFHENYPNIPKVKITTFTSRSAGDNSCIYQIKVIE